VQQRARCHGNAGIRGDAAQLEVHDAFLVADLLPGSSGGRNGQSTSRASRVVTTVAIVLRRSSDARVTHVHFLWLFLVIVFAASPIVPICERSYFAFQWLSQLLKWRHPWSQLQGRSLHRVIKSDVVAGGSSAVAAAAVPAAAGALLVDT
jgi:hypothetical protein